jgi:hypothetical protein
MNKAPTRAPLVEMFASVFRFLAAPMIDDKQECASSGSDEKRVVMIAGACGR